MKRRASKQTERDERGISTSPREFTRQEGAKFVNMAGETAPIFLQDAGNEKEAPCGVGLFDPIIEEEGNGLTGHFWGRGPDGPFAMDISPIPSGEISHV